MPNLRSGSTTTCAWNRPYWITTSPWSRAQEWGQSYLIADLADLATTPIRLSWSFARHRAWDCSHQTGRIALSGSSWQGSRSLRRRSAHTLTSICQLVVGAVKYLPRARRAAVYNECPLARWSPTEDF